MGSAVIQFYVIEFVSIVIFIWLKTSKAVQCLGSTLGQGEADSWQTALEDKNINWNVPDKEWIVSHMIGFFFLWLPSPRLGENLEKGQFLI